MILRFILLLLFSLQVKAESFVDYELDPYYSNIGLYVPLTEEPIKEVDLKDEEKIYSLLTRDLFSPRFFLIEASINPLPILGTLIREESPDFYNDAEVSDDFNLVEALTEGFEEPYALSFFLGNVIRFKLPDEKKPEAINKGYSGLLLSFGNDHIRRNELIDDFWYEVEWKLKGDRRIGPIYHSWSFRVGTKIHDNPDITDVAYLGIRRELFNDNLRGYRFLENTGIDLRADFATENSDMVGAQFYVEKRWPMDAGVFSLGLGVNRIIDKYTGELAGEGTENRLILRPMFLFH